MQVPTPVSRSNNSTVTSFNPAHTRAQIIHSEFWLASTLCLRKYRSVTSLFEDCQRHDTSGLLAKCVDCHMASAVAVIS